MQTILFNHQHFFCKEIFHASFGRVLISTESLNNAIMQHTGSYTNDEARTIDEQIFYFVDDDEIKWNNKKLAKMIAGQI